MLQEMPLKEALKKYISGRQVLILQPPCEDAVLGKDDYMIDDIERIFDGCRLLVDTPAVVNPDFERAVQEMESQSPPPKSLMEQIQALPLAPRNKPASVWVPVSNGKR